MARDFDYWHEVAVTRGKADPVAWAMLKTYTVSGPMYGLSDEEAVNAQRYRQKQWIAARSVVVGHLAAAGIEVGLLLAVIAAAVVLI